MELEFSYQKTVSLKNIENKKRRSRIMFGFLWVYFYLIHIVFDTRAVDTQKICNCKENQFCLIKSVTPIGNYSEYFYNAQCVSSCSSLFSISNNVKTVVECCRGENDCEQFAEKLASLKCEFTEMKYQKRLIKRADTSVLKYRRPRVKRCFKCDFCKSESEGNEEVCDPDTDSHYSCFNQISFMNGRRIWKSGCRKTALCVTSSQTTKTEKTKKGCCAYDMCNTLSNALNMFNTTLCETGF